MYPTDCNVNFNNKFLLQFGVTASSAAPTNNQYYVTLPKAFTNVKYIMLWQTEINGCIVDIGSIATTNFSVMFSGATNSPNRAFGRWVCVGY